MAVFCRAWHCTARRTLLIGLLSILNVSSGGAFAQKSKKTFVAYSMKIAEEKVRQAMAKEQDLRKTQPDVFYLGGITTPQAIVLDPRSGDWILLGERDPGSSGLTLDDWLVALRARFVHGSEDPGVSIDPIPCEACLRTGRRSGCPHGMRQEVRFFAGVEDSHFGQVCFDADWLMKKISLGIEVLPVERVRQALELRKAWWRALGAQSIAIGSRLWFYPIVSRVNVVGDVVVLEGFRMGVFTELMYAEVAGHTVDPLEFNYAPAEEFARGFSEDYNAATEMAPVLETLRGLTRLAALAKGLVQADSVPDLKYWFSAYPLEKTKTPSEVETLRMVEPELALETAGGVELMALVARISSVDAASLKKLVLATRPAATSLTWDFTTSAGEGGLTEVRVPAGDAVIQEAMGMLHHANVLLRQKHYSEAISLYDRLVEVLPQKGDVYLLRGAAYAQNGQYHQALTDFRRATQSDPHLAPAWTSLAFGSVLRQLHGDDTTSVDKLGVSRVIVQLSHALRLNPFDANARISLGLVYHTKGQYDRAIENFNEVLGMRVDDALIYFYRAQAFADSGDYERAIADYTHGLKLAPNDVLLYRYRGLAYYYSGDQSQAREDWERTGGFEREQRSRLSLRELFQTLEERLWR